MVALTAGCALPFYYAGIAITLVLTKCRLPVARVYASDLCGASLGCFLVLGGLAWLDAPSLILLCGAIGAMAGFLFLCSRDTPCAEPNGTTGDFAPVTAGVEIAESAAAAAREQASELAPLAPDHGSTIQRPRLENGIGTASGPPARCASGISPPFSVWRCWRLSTADPPRWCVRSWSKARSYRRPGSPSSGGTLSPALRSIRWPVVRYTSPRRVRSAPPLRQIQ